MKRGLAQLSALTILFAGRVIGQSTPTRPTFEVAAVMLLNENRFGRHSYRNATIGSTCAARRAGM
jgi:hypothetical protein